LIVFLKKVKVELNHMNIDSPDMFGNSGRVGTTIFNL